MKHKFISTLPNGTNPSLVDQTQWNDTHVWVPRPISATQAGVQTDDWIQATGGSGGISYTLPLTTTGQPIRVMKVDSGAGAVTVLPGTGTINSLNALAQSSYALTNPGQYAEFTFDGTNFWVTANN